MAGEVVGTAYVRIKALTDKLAKDIEKDIKKGMENANLDKAARDKGEEAGGEFGDGFADEAGSTLKKRSKNIVPEDDITDGFKNTFKGVRNDISQLDLFSDIQEQFDEIDLVSDKELDVAVGFDTSSADRERVAFLNRIRASFGSIGGDIGDEVADELGASLTSSATDIGEEVGTEFSDSLEVTIKRNTKNIVPEDDITDGFKNTFSGVKNNINQLDLFSNIQEQFDQIDLFTDKEINVPIGFDTTIADREREVFLGKTRAAFGSLGGDVGDEFADELGNSLAEASDVFARLGEDFVEEFADSADDTFKRRINSIVPEDDIRDGFKGTFKGVKADLDQLDLFGDVSEKFDQIDLFDASDLDFAIDLDMSDAENEAERAFNSIRDDSNKLGRDIDSGDLGESLDRLSAKFKNLGSSGSFSLGPLRGALLGIGSAILAALPYIQDVGAAILAYATGLVAQIGFITTAVGGISVAAVTALGSVAIAAIPIALAFKAPTEALATFKDSMAAAGEEFLRIGTATQVTLLPSLDKAVFVLGDLVPLFSEFGLLTGRSVGNFATLAAETLVGAEAQGRFRDIMQTSLHLIDVLTPTLIDVGNILSGLWVAALPSAQRFAETLSTIVDRWSDLVTEGLQTGELTRTLDTWYGRAETLGSALGNLSGALFDILEVGADSSDNVFIRFDQWAERFRDFTESEVGKNKLALIFDNALAVMREVNAIAADLFDGIFGRLAEVGGVDSMVAALQKFRDVIPEIQEFWDDALTTIDEVVRLFASNVWEKIKQAWEQMADPLGRLGTQLLDLLEVMNESGAFEVFLDLMETLTDVLSTILAIPGLGQFIAYFIAFNSAIKIASLTLGPFIRVFGGFASILINLIKIGAGAQLTGLAGGLTRFAAGVSAANATKGLSSLATDASRAGSAAGGLAGQLGLAAAPLLAGGPLTLGIGVVAGALAVGGAAFFKYQQDVQKWEQEVRQATDALGLFNDGLLITADGVAEYIRESSRFESRNQLDDLGRIGLSVESLAEQFENGTQSVQRFTDRALKAQDVRVSFRTTGPTGAVSFTDAEVSSLEELQEQYKLTDEQLNDLINRKDVYTDSTLLVLSGNLDLIESFKEVNRAIGAAAKDNIDEFVTNADNIAILGSEALAKIRDDIKGASDEEAADLQVDALRRINDGAKALIPTFDTLDQATRDQIHTQVQSVDASIRAATEYGLLADALEIQNEKIRENLTLFASADFAKNFGPAKQAVLDFNAVLEQTSLTGGLTNLDPDGNLDYFQEKLPLVGGAAVTLFETLKGLPVAEFNASAEALGLDAGALRGAMEGAQQAIIDLQQEALSTLPSIGELLDQATEVKEDGSQYFDKKGFIDSVNTRITDTTNFAKHINDINIAFGLEAAQLALQQGPAAAAALASMIGADEVALDNALAGMEASEEALKIQIEKIFGPAIAAQYLAVGGVIGESYTGGLTSGIKDPATLRALEDASREVLAHLANTFQGRFVIGIGGDVKFVPSSGGERKWPIRPTKRFSEGGYVGGDSYGSGFAGGSNGTDTIPAWLTPGEFVLRRTVAQAIPSKTLMALNSGDPRILGLLTAINKNRPGTPTNLMVSSAELTAAAAASSPGISIGQMNIAAPAPLESARMVSDRLRILQSQLARR